MASKESSKMRADVLDSNNDSEIWDSMAVMHSEQWENESHTTADNLKITHNDAMSLPFNEAGEKFLQSAEYGDLTSLSNLLSAHPNLLPYKDTDCYTAIHRASYNGHVPVIKYLLENGSDISARTDDGWQAIHCAAKWNKYLAVSILLQNGADPNSKTYGGLTPLHLAASNSYSRKTLEVLLMEPSIDANIKSPQNTTAQGIAESYGRLGYLFEIKEGCVDFNY